MRNSAISSSIKELRVNKKLSQEDLSEKSGLSLRTIQRLENGESIPRGDSLKRLADALEIPADYFNNTTEIKKYNSSKRQITIPWYLIGLVIICGSVGFLLSLFIAISDIVFIPSDANMAVVYGTTILFVGIGIVCGNFFEKKYRK